GQAVRPIALRQIMEIARACPGAPISGMGGIETGRDAAEFLLMGSHTLQVCTGAMLQGYGCISTLNEELLAIMADHGFDSPGELVGHCLPYFTTHADLVERQRAARRAKAGQSGRDEMWSGDIAGETNSLVTE
ncbi:MAG: NAD-dependent dihydropyrimidine dehydrogenase subunit PreA, partial [Planctomycetota bacterium]|nr:NAD-dependent dihydropyrimidine dehydrogenase subunit PreA [Planctomycetota bacterium]